MWHLSFALCLFLTLLIVVPSVNAELTSSSLALSVSSGLG